MKKLAVVPARGGSKGIPGKNIYPVNGKPLLEYTLDLLSEAGLEDTDIVVSTDSPEIKRVAVGYRNIRIIDRPTDISGDKASTESALLHAMDVMEQETGVSYEAILTLQATSPLRKVETLRKFIKAYEESYPVYDAQLSLNEDAPRRRQERKPLYVENSAYYITDAKALRKTNSVLGTCANGFIISVYEAIDINEPVDILIAEEFLRQQKWGRIK